MSAGLSTEALERLWLALSVAITAAGPEREAVFLAKLALLLSQELGDEARIAALIETAQKDL